MLVLPLNYYCVKAVLALNCTGFVNSGIVLVEREETARLERGWIEMEMEFCVMTQLD